METLSAAVDEVASATGFSGAVRVDGPEGIRVERTVGLADRAHRVPITPATRFGLASVTKGLTALVVLRLVADEVLILSTTARSLLGPDLPMIDDSVTVEHLLAHRSGIGDYLDEEVLEADAYVLPVPVHRLVDAEDYLEVLDGYPQRAAPGERFVYCNGGYVVLALLAERATGTPYHDLVADLVCGPAGMTRTAFLRGDELPGDVATGYLAAAGLRSNVLHLPVRGCGDGGVHAPVEDLHRLWQALFAGRIVPERWVVEATRPRSTTPSGRHAYGLGFWLSPDGDRVQLEGGDAGVSVRTEHRRGSGVTWTVVANTTAGAWPVARAVEDQLEDAVR